MKTKRFFIGCLGLVFWASMFCTLRHQIQFFMAILSLWSSTLFAGNTKKLPNYLFDNSTLKSNLRVNKKIGHHKDQFTKEEDKDDFGE